MHASQGTNGRIVDIYQRTSRKNLAALSLHEHGLPSTLLRLIDEFCESDVGTVAHAPRKSSISY